MTRCAKSGCAGDRAQRGELRRGEARDVVRVRMRIGHAVELRLVGRSGQRHRAAKLARFFGHGPHPALAVRGMTRASPPCCCASRHDQVVGCGMARAVVGNARRTKQASCQARRAAMTAITDIIGREILDSRGNPTVEVEVTLEDGSRRPRRRALRRLDRRARGGRAARRRQEALSRQGRAEGGGRGRNGDLRRHRRHGRRGPGPDRRDDDRARRHAEQGAARRQRDPRRVARGRQGRGYRQRAAALSLRRRHLGAAPAGADDEHRQRRRACRQPDRLPGIHDHAGRRAELRRRPALGRRGVPDPEEGAARRRATTPTSATRAALRPTSSRPRKRWASS